MKQLLFILILFALVLVGGSRVDGQGTTAYAGEPRSSNKDFTQFVDRLPLSY